ncbi:MAG: PAS domain S-box protein [Deltaproteobacteria bacterium]|nr:PAS domain S-box protein [Deltaproteobacteria bacterium]
MRAEPNPEELKQTIKVLEEKCVCLGGSDQKFRSLFNGSMDGLLIVESGGGRIICANKQVGTMMGYAEGALHGRDFHVLLPATTNQPKRALLQEVQVCGGVFTQDFVHSDGRVCVLDLMVTLTMGERLGDSVHLAGCLRTPSIGGTA